MRVTACIPLSFALVASAFAQTGLPQKYAKPTPKPTQTIATVDGKPITAGQIEPLLWEWYGKQATQDLVSYLLVSRDAAKRGLVVADADVEKAVDEQLKALQASRSESPAEASRWLEEQGFTRSRLFLRLKAKLLMDKVLLTDFRAERYVKVSTILVRTTSSEASALSASIAKAQDAYTKLQQGQDWDAVLKATTSEEKAVKSHGVLGWREISAFPDSVQVEMKTLKLGGYTRPAQTTSGIQLFRLDGRGTEAKGTALADLKNMYLEVNRPQYVKALQAKMILQPGSK